MFRFWFLLSPWKKFLYAIGLVATIFVVLFAIVNWQDVRVNLIFFEFQTSVTLLILVCALLGFVSSSVWTSRKLYRKDQEIKTLRDELQQAKRSEAIQTTPEA